MLPEEVGPSLLEVFEELAVVDKLHLVGVRIPDPDCGGVLDHIILGGLADPDSHALNFSMRRSTSFSGFNFESCFNSARSDFLQDIRRLFGVPVRPTQRFGDDHVDDPLLLQVGRGQLQRLGGLFLEVPASPEDARA